MCGSRDSSHTTSGGLYHSSKVASLSIQNWVFVFYLSSIRLKMPRNPGTLGLGAVATNPDMVLQVRCTGARVGAGWKVGVLNVCAEVVGKVGARA